MEIVELRAEGANAPCGARLSDGLKTLQGQRNQISIGPMIYRERQKILFDTAVKFLKDGSTPEGIVKDLIKVALLVANIDLNAPEVLKKVASEFQDAVDVAHALRKNHLESPRPMIDVQTGVTKNIPEAWLKD